MNMDHQNVYYPPHSQQNIYITSTGDLSRQPMYSNLQYYNPMATNHVGSTPYYQNMQPVQMASQPRSQLIRPTNENAATVASFNPRAVYSNYQNFMPNPNTGANFYTQATFGYPMQTNTTALSIPPQQSYAAMSNPSMHTMTDPSSGVPAPQRTRKPIPIVDPNSKEPVRVPEQNLTSSTTNNPQHKPSKDLSMNPTKTTNEPVQTEQKQAVREEFQKKVAESLRSSNPIKTAPNTPTEPIQIEKKTDIKQTEIHKSVQILPPSDDLTPGVDQDNVEENDLETPLSEKEPIIQEQVKNDDSCDTIVDPPEILIKPDEEEKLKVNHEDPIENVDTTDAQLPVNSRPPLSSSNSKSSESESVSSGSRPSISKRASYTIEELIKKRDDPLSRVRPDNLRHIEGVTVKKALNSGFFPHYSSSRQSLTLHQPEFHNRVENPYKAVNRTNRNQVDEDETFVREVKSILNKLTPQTYDKLVEKLEALDLNSEYRLDEMISITFHKAVDEPSFCSIYATVCKQFERRQIQVVDISGQTKTHSYRQKLLSRCQKEFESDYRQDIHYETRKAEVDQILDEKEQKEKAENLEEDLGKAKRKKFGNIFFIGELFKLQMLTENIMSQCLEFLMRDKKDEEGLECLCRLLTTIGEKLDAKLISGTNAKNRSVWDQTYADLQGIVDQRKISARIRFMIQDLLDLRKANWVARRVEAKPQKIDEIHQTARLQREQEEAQNERDRQRRDQGRSSNSSHYGESRGNRGSGIKQQYNRNEEERETHFNVASLRQLQNNDKKNQGQPTLMFAPPCAWNKGSNTTKKPEEDRSNNYRTGKPPAPISHHSKSKTSASPSGPNPYTGSNQSSREISRENVQRSEESSTKNSSGASRQLSRQGSRDSNVAQNPTVKDSNSDDSKTKFDEEKTQKRVKSLIEEFTENYSDNSDRPVKEALDDLSDFTTSNTEQKILIVRELFLNVIEDKTRARKAVGQLLVGAFQRKILCEESILKGFKSVTELAPDLEVDIPLIWRYFSEIVGAFVGASESTIVLLKPLIKLLDEKQSLQFFQDSINAAIEFTSKSHLENVFQSSNITLKDLLDEELMNSLPVAQYDFLDKRVPRADDKLVSLLMSIEDAGENVLKYIEENMKKENKFFIRNIVLSFLKSCFGSPADVSKTPEDIPQKSCEIVRKIINQKLENEIQAVYAIQNHVHSLQHPNKMARLLFDLFYDLEFASEEAFYAWRDNQDQSESEGHSVVSMSTKDFFIWLEEESDADEDEKEKNNEETETRLKSN